MLSCSGSLTTSALACPSLGVALAPSVCFNSVGGCVRSFSLATWCFTGGGVRANTTRPTSRLGASSPEDASALPLMSRGLALKRFREAGVFGTSSCSAGCLACHRLCCSRAGRRRARRRAALLLPPGGARRAALLLRGPAGRAWANAREPVS